MAPLPIALVPGKCPGHTRLNGTKAPICHTCGCHTYRKSDIEPLARFVDGRFDCVNWRGHGVANVLPIGETRKSAERGGEGSNSEHTAEVMRLAEQTGRA